MILPMSLDVDGQGFPALHGGRRSGSSIAGAGGRDQGAGRVVSRVCAVAMTSGQGQAGPSLGSWVAAVDAGSGGAGGTRTHDLTDYEGTRISALQLSPATAATR